MTHSELAVDVVEENEINESEQVEQVEQVEQPITQMQADHTLDNSNQEISLPAEAPTPQPIVQFWQWMWRYQEAPVEGVDELFSPEQLADLVKMYPDYKEAIFERVNTDENFSKFTENNAYELAKLVKIFPKHKDTLFQRASKNVSAQELDELVESLPNELLENNLLRLKM